MTDIGTPDTKKVNSKLTRLYIRPSGADIEYLQLQDKELLINNQIELEPTTSGGLGSFTGFLDGTLTGTLLFTNDLASAVGGYTELNTRTNGEVPAKTWRMKLTDMGGTTQQWEFSAKLDTFRLTGPAVGAQKYQIVLRLLTEPTVT